MWHHDDHGHHHHHHDHGHHDPHRHDHTHGHHDRDHDHDREHAHEHSHAHEHTPLQIQPGDMRFGDKLAKLLDHWLRHNDEHVRSYREWAEQARANGLQAVAAHIDAAARATEKVSATFSAALAELRKP